MNKSDRHQGRNCISLPLLLTSLSLLVSSTDETSSSLLLHLQEFILSKATKDRPTEARLEWCSDASGAVSSPW